MKVRKFNDNEKFVVTSSSTCLFFANTYREVLSKKFSIHFCKEAAKKILELTKIQIVINCILNAWKTLQLPNGF